MEKKQIISSPLFFLFKYDYNIFYIFPILDCSPLFPTDFGFILVLGCGHQILCIFMKSKTDFYAFLLILVWSF